MSKAAGKNLELSRHIPKGGVSGQKSNPFRDMLQPVPAQSTAGKRQDALVGHRGGPASMPPPWTSELTPARRQAAVAAYAGLDGRQAAEFEGLAAHWVTWAQDNMQRWTEVRHLFAALPWLYRQNPGCLLAEVPTSDLHTCVATSSSTKAVHTMLRKALSQTGGQKLADARLPARDQGNHRVPRIAVHIIPMASVLAMDRACRTWREASQFSLLAYTGQAWQHIKDAESSWIKFAAGKCVVAWPPGHELHGLEAPVLRGEEALDFYVRILEHSPSQRIFQHPDGTPWKQADDWEFLQMLAGRAGIHLSPMGSGGERLVNTTQLRITMLVHMARTTFSEAAIDGLLHQVRVDLLGQIMAYARKEGPDPFRLSTRMHDYLHPTGIESLRCPRCCSELVGPGVRQCPECSVILATNWYQRDGQQQATTALIVRTLVERLDDRARQHAMDLVSDSKMPWNQQEAQNA